MRKRKREQLILLAKGEAMEDKNQFFSYEMDTDLALEAGECLTKSGRRAEGVAFEEEEAEGGMIHITKVTIRDQEGAKLMGKPMGQYITLESALMREENGMELCAHALAGYIRQLLPSQWKTVLAVGLGNRELTVDSLGPRVIDNLFMTHHREGEGLCGLAPGVMAQTGMETADIVKGVAGQTKPDVVIAVDALAARSASRLGTTIQLTDTGITPGSGVGNHRNSLTKESLGIPVIAIGVPMVIKAVNIAYDTLHAVLKVLNTEKAFEGACDAIRTFSPQEAHGLVEELLQPSLGDLCVTPKDIDELVYVMGKAVAEAINGTIHHRETPETRESRS